jgi:hypothetical protein
MSGDSVERWRVALVGEWEPVLTGASLLHLRRANRSTGERNVPRRARPIPC